jgi:polysaccharide biosynthesis/export protein
MRESSMRGLTKRSSIHILNWNTDGQARYNHLLMDAFLAQCDRPMIPTANREPNRHLRALTTFTRVARVAPASFLGSLLLVGSLLLMGGCAHRSTPPDADFTVRRDAGPTILSRGDQIRLTFRKLPDLNQTQKIRSDGSVSLLQVGTVKAAGKSLDSFQRELATRYELKTAGDLTVSLESTFTAVYVTGAVQRPGKVVIDRPMTVLEAIMESGGFDRESANLKGVSLTRLVNGKYVTRVINMRDHPEDALYVRPYDMIEVPRFFY